MRNMRDPENKPQIETAAPMARAGVGNSSVE